MPSAWRDQGYLVLVYNVKGQHVRYLHTRDGEQIALAVDFEARMSPVKDNPHYLALNLLARVNNELIQMRATTRRKIAAMLTIEELAKLSERQLADEYKSIMGSGPTRIKSDVREARIQEMIKKVRKDAEANNGSSDDMALAGSSVDPSVTEEQAMAKTKKGKTPKAKAPKAAAKEKTPKVVAKQPKPKVVRDASAGNGSLYRAGSMKAAGYDFYLKHPEDRAKCVAFMVDKGASESTAKSWYFIFSRA